MASLAVTPAASSAATQVAKAPASDNAQGDTPTFAQMLNAAGSNSSDQGQTNSTDGASMAAADQSQADAASTTASGKKFSSGKKSAQDAANDNNGSSTQQAFVPTQQTQATLPDASAQAALLSSGNNVTSTSATTGNNTEGEDEVVAAADAQNVPQLPPAAGNTSGAKTQAQTAQNQAAQDAAGTDSENGQSSSDPVNAVQNSFKTFLQDQKDSSAQPEVKSAATSEKSSDNNAALIQPQPADTAPTAASSQTAINFMGVAPANSQAAAGAGASGTTQTQVAAQTPTPNVNALAVEIAARSQSGSKQFDIRLDPPELGRVEVRLSIDSTGKAQAHMTADQPQTLELLQNDAPSLTQALRDAGLDVSQNGLNFSLRGQGQQSGDNSQGFSGQSGGKSSSLAAAKTIDAVQSSTGFSSSGSGLLDIHV